MYQLHFTLKQHTPIIHFQWQQDGATLRASEVKPKLDRFIIEQLGKEADSSLTDYEEIYKAGLKVAKDNGWLIDKEGKKGALDYKMRIESCSSVEYFLPYPTTLNSNRYPNKEENFRNYLGEGGFIDFEFHFLLPSPFFANADKIKFYDRSERPHTQNSKPDELIWAVKTDSDLFGRIETLNSNLKEEIKNNLLNFFLQNNFGTRQNKGFGSFTLSSLNNENCDIQVKQLKNIFIKKSNNQQTNVFKFILTEYNLLKSGQNNPFNERDYKKSKLFEYFILHNIRWEKRYIKQNLNSNGVQLKMREAHKFEPIDYNDSMKDYYNEFNDKQTNNYKYVRALLGLAENYEFATNNRGRLKVKIIHKKSSSHNEKIERFQSPIFFKVIDNIVYLSINDSYKLIEGASFEFYDNNNLLGKTLNIPNNFDLQDFIDKSISHNWSNL